MSTPWFAARCAFVFSVEDNEQWFKKVSALLQQRHCHNVRHVLRPLATYTNLSEFSDGFFDFALIDGEKRDECVAAAFPKIKPGGYIYLDNGDFAGGHVRRVLLDAAKERGGAARVFIDFAPGISFVTQGVMVRLGDGATDRPALASIP